MNSFVCMHISYKYNKMISKISKISKFPKISKNPREAKTMAPAARSGNPTLLAKGAVFIDTVM